MRDIITWRRVEWAVEFMFAGFDFILDGGVDIMGCA